ncbi:MAG TPA: hypothetical protein VN980_03380 [Alphaproteobacteria bacterium]|nr:hypothetical protein [Alphaproteobacteria bacterium]
MIGFWYGLVNLAVWAACTVGIIGGLVLVVKLPDLVRWVRLGQEVERERDVIREAIRRGEIDRAPDHIAMPAHRLFTEQEKQPKFALCVETEKIDGAWKITRSWSGRLTD